MIVRNGKIIALDKVIIEETDNFQGDGTKSNPLKVIIPSSLGKVHHDDTLNGDGTEDNILGVNATEVMVIPPLYYGEYEGDEEEYKGKKCFYINESLLGELIEEVAKGLTVHADVYKIVSLNDEGKPDVDTTSEDFNKNLIYITKNKDERYQLWVYSEDEWIDLIKISKDINPDDFLDKKSYEADKKELEEQLKKFLIQANVKNVTPETIGTSICQDENSGEIYRWGEKIIKDTTIFFEITTDNGVFYYPKDEYESIDDFKNDLDKNTKLYAKNEIGKIVQSDRTLTDEEIANCTITELNGYEYTEMDWVNVCPSIKPLEEAIAHFEEVINNLNIKDLTDRLSKVENQAQKNKEQIDILSKMVGNNPKTTLETVDIALCTEGYSLMDEDLENDKEILFVEAVRSKENVEINYGSTFGVILNEDNFDSFSGKSIEFGLYEYSENELRLLTKSKPIPINTQEITANPDMDMADEPIKLNGNSIYFLILKTDANPKFISSLKSTVFNRRYLSLINIEDKSEMPVSIGLDTVTESQARPYIYLLNKE